jgi:hypothetical protein
MIQLRLKVMCREIAIFRAIFLEENCPETTNYKGKLQNTMGAWLCEWLRE